jgi:hypothetical protein
MRIVLELESGKQLLSADLEDGDAHIQTIAVAMKKGDVVNFDTDQGRAVVNASKIIVARPTP